MELSTLSVSRTQKSPVFWPQKFSRLVVVISTTTYRSTACLIAYGVEVKPHVDTVVFERLLPEASLGDFLKALVDDESPGDTLSADWYAWENTVGLSGDPIAYSVDITHQLPPPDGPKMTVVLTYASTVSISQMLAETNGSVTP
jgi:hypothetical protein